MRLILTSFISILALFMILLTARFWGQGQSFTPYSHVFFDFLSPSPETKPPTPADREQPKIFVKYKNLEDLRLSPLGEALYVDLLVSKDAVFAINFNPTLKSLQNFDSSHWPEHVLPFSDFQSFLQGRCVIVNVGENLGGIHNHVQKLLAEFNIKEASCFAITSETESVVKSIKEILPRFIYGSARAEVMTMLSMQSMFLLPAFKIRSDLVITPLKSKNRTIMTNADLIDESHRQFKKYIIGPLDNAEDIAIAKSLNPDAIIVVR